MKKDNRRKFLQKTMLGISGIAFVPGSMNRFPTVNRSTGSKPELPSRILGRTGIKTPLISFGTSGATDTGFIRAVYEAGVKLFFSATYYGEGNNEKLVGEALRDLPRDSFIIGTACPPDGMDNKTGTFPKGFDADAYIKKAEGSLKRFGLDYVDIFLFPYAGKKEVVQDEGVLKVLEQLKKQGKTRFVGIASHTDVEEALRAAADSGVYDVAMPAYNFKTANRESMNAALAYAAKAGIGIVAMKTTAGAFRNKSGPALNSNAVLKWVLQNENIASVVSGMSTLEQLQKNIAMIGNIDLTDEEQKELTVAGMVSESGLYCHQCKKCLSQCPHNLDIPSMMRSYMYAYGYKNIEQAWYTMAGVELNGRPCNNCISCCVKCTAGFDIKRKISDITRLKDIPHDFTVA